MMCAKLDMNWGMDSGLKHQLQQVDNHIKVREECKVDQDFFFISIGGRDMHSNMKQGVFNRFNEMDQGFKSFVAEMKAQSMQEYLLIIFNHSLLSVFSDPLIESNDHLLVGSQ